MPAIGYVTRDKDSFKGFLRTLTVSTRIEIVPNTAKATDSQPDYRVLTPEGTELGAGWNRKGQQSGQSYISLAIAAPELPARLLANLGRVAGNDDPEQFAIIWNPPS